MGLFRQGRYLLLLTAAINLVTSIWLGTYWGLFGILVATAVARLCTNTWYDPYKVFKHGFGASVLPYYRRRLSYLMILTATGALSYYLANLVNGSLLFTVIYKFIVCCIVPNAVFYALFHKKSEFKYYIELLHILRVKIITFLRGKLKSHSFK